MFLQARPSVGHYLTTAFTIFFIIPCKDMKKDFQNALLSGKNDKTCVFKVRGTILREIPGNVSFTIANFKI